MEENLHRHRKKRIKVIHHHIHHYHNRNQNCDCDNPDGDEIKTTSHQHHHSHHRVHHHHHHHHSFHDEYEEDFSPPNRKLNTYYVTEIEKKNNNEDRQINNHFPNKIPNSYKPSKIGTTKRDNFPYPIKTINYLKHHPFPAENEDLDIPPIDPKQKEPIKSLRTIDDYYPKYSQKNSYHSYWLDIEPVIVFERTGGYVEIPPKQRPMMYPFTQMSPRKLPWDYSDVDLVPTRPNKPAKPLKLMSFSHCERFVLEMMRVPTPGDSPTHIMRSSDEFQSVEFWIQTCLGASFSIDELIRLGLSSLFLEFERSYPKLVLVLYPCKNPLNFYRSPFPNTMIVHRCVSKIESPRPRAFLLCAAYLGNESIDYHPNCILTERRITNLRKHGYHSFFYREKETESILILDTSKVVPLYSIKMNVK